MGSRAEGIRDGGIVVKACSNVANGGAAARALSKDVVLRTGSPAHVPVVTGRGAVGNLDVVAGSLVPSNHLLGTGEALG